MVELPKIIVLISKSLVRVAKVVGTDLQDPIEMEWKPELLRKGFAVIKSRYQTARIRLVLDDDLSHTLELTIPALTSEADERSAVESKIREQIPEVLTAGNWDYKVKETSVNGKVVTVFVPVQETFITITDAATKEGLEIEAVEPISISLSRDPDPFVGMAKKTDLRGDDDDVLNIQPIFTPEATGALADPTLAEVTTSAPAGETAMTTESSTSQNKPAKKYIVIGVAVVLVGLLSFGVVRALRTTGDNVTPSPTPSVVVASPVASPEPSPVAIADLKLQVLNGSGVPGQAGVAAKKLATAGFGEAKTGNAESYTYKKTEVQLKSSLPDSVYTQIADALEPDFTVMKTDALSSSSEFDIVVTVGTNQSLPSPTPKPSVSPSPKASASPSPSPSPSGSPKPSSSASPLPSGSPSPSPSASGN